MTYAEFIKVLNLLSTMPQTDKEEFRDYLLVLQDSEDTTTHPSSLLEKE